MYDAQFVAWVVREMGATDRGATDRVVTDWGGHRLGGHRKGGHRQGGHRQLGHRLGSVQCLFLLHILFSGVHCY